MNIDIIAIKESLISAIIYLPETLKLVFVSLILGIIIGGTIAIIRVYKFPILSQIFAVLVPVYQGVPIVVALLIYNLIYLMKMDDILRALHIQKTIADIDSIYIGIFALTLMITCNTSEVIRGALLSVNIGQNEAGYSVGLTKVQTIKRIIIPQAIPVAIPTLINNIVGLIKGSSIVMVVGINEVLAGALVPSAKRYTFFEGYLAAALVYWGLTIVVEMVASKSEKELGKFRRTI